MNKSGIGIGSASVVLVFVVLCLTVFAIISHTAARNDKALTDVETELVKNYYEADTMAECILAEFLAADTFPVPYSILGVELTMRQDPELAVETAEFSCPVSGDRELYVKVAIYGDSYDILSWRMRSTREWTIDNDQPVWLGE